MEFIELIESYGGWGSYTLIVIGLIYAVRYFHLENKSLKKGEVTAREAHFDDLRKYLSVAQKMTDVIEAKKYGK